VRHRLGLATRTQISVCMSSFPSAGTTVSLFRVKTVQQRPLLLREVETRLPDCEDMVVTAADSVLSWLNVTVLTLMILMLSCRTSSSVNTW